MAGRNISGVTLNDFFAAVLRQMGAPVTANNLAKLGAVAQKEGHGGDYNPFNYVDGPGTNFNSVGVKNYPDLQTGVNMTVRLLTTGKAAPYVKANLLSDGNYASFLSGMSNFYRSWGGPSINISQGTANTKLRQQIDGPVVSAQARAAMGTGGVSGVPPSGDPNDPLGWASTKKWMDAQQNAFTTWLKQQPTARQQQIVNWFKADQPLAEVGRLLNAPTTEAPLKEYIQNYLAQLPKDVQRQQATSLAVVPQSAGAPAPTSKPSPELTNLLKSLGVSYPNAPQPTPALLAFLNGIGLNLQTAQQLKDRAIARIGATASDAMADIDRTAGRTKQNITADLVRRGVVSSGEANTRYARQAEDVAAQRADVTRTTSQAKESATDTYQQARDLARQQALDRVISAEQDQATAAATSKAQQDALKAQQDASDLAWARQQAAQQDAIAQQTKLMNQYAQQGVVV